MMNRRNFLKALTVTAAGIVVPELIVPEKRFWALDRTMLGYDYTDWFDGSYAPITKWPKSTEYVVKVENPEMFLHPDYRLVRIGNDENAGFGWIDCINQGGSIVIRTWDGTIVST
jgi:hypothetical protein